MCNPAIIPLVLTAFTAVNSAQQATAQGKYQKGVADYNVRVAQNTAQDVRNQGTEAENAYRQQVAELVSRQRAQLGASGVSLDSGSPLQIQQDALTLGEADALRIRSNTTSKVNSLNTQSGLTQSQGDMSLLAGDNAASGSLLNGVAGIMGSGVADKWFSSKSAAKG